MDGLPARYEAFLATDLLQLIVMPTEHCNFRCTYCYEDFEIGRMRPEILDGIRRLIHARMAGLSRFQLSWFGGEPMLAHADVVALSREAQRLASSSGTTFVSDITTNASLLTPSRFEELVGAGVTVFQVTLDGPAELHDKTRVSVNGKGTFTRIHDNLMAALRTDLHFDLLLRVHVHAGTRDLVPDLINLLRDFDDPRVRLFFRGISDLGGPHAGEIETMAPDECDALCHELYNLARSAAPSAQRFNAAPDAACYASMANSWVVRADGRLGKCTVALNDPRNEVGFLSPDGQMHVRADLVRPWLRGIFTSDEEALACPLPGLPKTVTDLPTPRIRTGVTA